MSGVSSEKELFVSEEITVGKLKLRRAFDKLILQAPDEVKDALAAYADRIIEEASSGESIDMCDVVADLLDYRKYGLHLDVVTDFLNELIGDKPRADSLISDTIECARRNIWGRSRSVIE